MNQRARHLIEKQKSSLKHSAEKLRSLLDNPDDFEVSPVEDMKLAEVISEIEQLRDRLRAMSN